MNARALCGTERPHHGMEHRWGLRIPCCAAVRISSGAAVIDFGRMRNVSMSGAYIESSVALPLFAPFEIAVLRGGRRCGAGLLASVVRCEAAGIGVEWAETIPGSICPLLDCAEPCASQGAARS
jgi:hypothetical protein